MERWDMFELTFDGKTDGNPFTDYEIYGTFTNENETKTVEGFYNGNGRYIVRFMPSFEGEYHCEHCDMFFFMNKYKEIPTFFKVGISNKTT